MAVVTQHRYRPFALAAGLASFLFVAFWQLTALSNAPAPATELLAIYALAFDNDPAYPAMSLTAAYTPTIQGIVSATINAPHKTAVVLADLAGYGDTRLLIIQRGVITTVVDWPDALQNRAMSSNGQEANMADGETLGYLIYWARQSFPASVTLFSFVGHGAPVVLVPPNSVGVPQPTSTPEPQVPAIPPPPLNPLPSRWAAHAGLTDHHSGSLLTLRDLDRALRIGTDNGTQPLTLLDLLHCFSASIEELYQVHPYAQMIAAAPNYAYSQPAMLGLALAALEPTLPAAQMVDLLVRTYDNALPVADHPRLSVGVDSQQLAPIKDAWDRTAYYLHQALLADPDTVKPKIKTAYATSAKYDTTLCSRQDWELTAPDALSDMADFAHRLGEGFGIESPIGSWAITTTQRISAALVSRVAHNGVPWFAKTGAPTWQLEAPGIALFTDFAPEQRNGQLIFSWQAPWYKSHHPAATDEPLSSFLVGGYAGVNWADLFQRFWQGQNLFTLGCQPSFLYSRGVNELRLVALQTATTTTALPLYRPVWLTATVQSSQPATNPLVRFSIYRGETLVYADVLSAGYLTGQQPTRVTLRQPWHPLAPGDYRLLAEVDIDERFVEQNEADNRQIVIVTVNPPMQLFMPLIRTPAA